MRGSKPIEAPVFVDRKTMAALFMVSIDTVNKWLRDGVLPPAHLSRGQIERWHWPSIERDLLDGRPDEDPFVTGARHATA